MTSLIKKIFLIITIAVLSIGFTVNAAEPVSLDLPEEFYIHSKKPEKVAEILNLKEKELSDYCMNNSILFLAVNGDNSKQIRVSVGENEFSNSVVNISNLSDDKISYLAPDIAGIEGIRGKTVNLNGQKFLVIQTKSKDSGGEYILTQYITVAARQIVVLSFYNDLSVDTGYIENVFKSFSSPIFIDDNSEARINVMLILVPIAFIVFLIACVGLAVSVILDIKKHKEEYDEEEYYEEEENTQTEEKTSETTDNTEETK